MNLLIVDDERIILNGVSNPNNWKSLEIDNIYTADNAFDAFKIVETEKVDIVISDITMPEKNGLELCEDINKKYPDIYLIILSGYDYFEYAQKAMQIGVNEYLLKPATIEKIKDSVSKAILYIKSETEKKKHMSEIENVFEDNIVHLREKWIKTRIQNGKISKDEAIKNINLYNINLDVDNNQMAVISIKDFDNNKTWGKNDIFLVRFALLNIISEILDAHKIKFVADYDMNYNLVVIYEPSKCELTDWTGEVLEIVAKNIDINLEIGQSKNCSFTDLKSAYIKACEGMFSKELYNENSTEKDPSIQNMWRVSYKIEDDILKSVNSGDIAMIYENINTLFKNFQDVEDITYLKGICIGIVFVVIQRMFPGNNSNAENDEKRRNILSEIKNTKTYEDLKNIVFDYFCDLSQDKNDENKTFAKDVIAVAKRYTDEHIGEDVSLQTVASMVYMNPNYFSNLFKKKTGISFSEYVIEKKTELAKEWLKDESVLIYDVAERLGFNDQRYFSSFFKKRTGMTPTQYREEHMKEK